LVLLCYKLAETLWSSLVNCGRLSISPLPRPQPTGGGNQPPRRFSTCPTSMAHTFCDTVILVGGVHQLDEAIDDGTLRTTGFKPRCGDLITDLIECRVVWNVAARSVGVGNHDGVAQRRFLAQAQVNLRQHFARYTRQRDVIDAQQPEPDLHRIGVLELVFFARPRTRLDLAARTRQHLLHGLNTRL